MFGSWGGRGMNVSVGFGGVYGGDVRRRGEEPDVGSSTAGMTTTVLL